MRRRRSNTLILGLLATGGLTAVALAVAAGLSVGRPVEVKRSPVTYENFSRIIPGMTRTEVIAILGTNFEAQAETSLPIGGHAEALVWENESGGRIVISFHNGEVVTRIQEGLKRRRI